MSLLKMRLGSLLLLSLVALPLFSQQTSGNLVGTVFDPTGAVVAGAPVKAHNAGTDRDESAVTTSSGQYTLANLPAGTYVVSVAAPGFARAEIQNVQVVLNQTVTSNFTLQLSANTQTVEVTTAAAPIDTTTAQIQNTFSTKEITDLPSASSGSGVINLSLLAPGVSTSGGIGQGTGPSIGGQRPTNNSYTIEGIDNNNKSVTGPLVTVPNDAVAEFTLLRNQFSPEFGHSSGGQFNEVVKSGTNSFHGAAYEYFENKNLNSPDNLNFVEGNPAFPRFDSNRFGGNVGGPIKRNKMFFFVDYEYQPQGSTSSTFYDTPTAAGYTTLAGLPGINKNNLAQFQKYFGIANGASAGTALIAPSLMTGAGALNSEGGGTGVFAAADPAAAGAISIPLVQQSSSLPSFTNTEYGVAAFDYTISDKDNLRSRFILNREGSIDTAGFPSAFFTTIPDNFYLVTVSEYHTFSPSVTNEFRLGYNRFFNTTPVPAIAYPGLDQFPSINVYEENITLGPDGNGPQSTIQNTYQLADNLSWTRGKHSLKFGFDGWKSISPQNFLQRSRGDYEWDYLTDFLYDISPDYFAERSVGSGAYSGDQFLLGWYGNDSWKVRSNLTVNLGLRYELETVPYTERLQSLNAQASAPGILTFGKPTTQLDAFMPRIGIAYSPGTSGKTSIRAGFGRGFDVLYDNLGILSSGPQFNSTTDYGGFETTGFLAGGGISPVLSVPTTTADARANTAGYIPNQRRPESLQWNFGIQHVFGNNFTFDTSYIGTRGISLPVQVRLNEQPVVNAGNALPVYFTAPTQAQLNTLPHTLAALTTAYGNGGYFLPSYTNAGFESPITAFMPVGNSSYNGWANSLTKQLTNGLQFSASYTWSHAIDDSTATAFTTLTTPRRAQDNQNLVAERASSGLDHRQRFTYQLLYDIPFFKHSNWFLKNLVGNWEVAPIYTYQTGSLYTVQSGVDANLNSDSAGDRTIINPNGGAAGSSTTTMPLTNTNGDVVAYQVVDPSAHYVVTPKGALATSGRNTEHFNPIDDIDLTAAKRINITERFRMEFSARAFNILNHPQYSGGSINDVAPVGFTGTLEKSFLTAGNAIFNQPSQAFSSNPRSMQLALKLIF